MAIGERYEGILKGAADVIARRGFHQASIREIARAAGLSLAGLYHYVGGKDELLFMVLDRSLDRLIASLDAALVEARNPEGRLLALLQTHLGFGFHHAQALKIINRDYDLLPEPQRSEIATKRQSYLHRGLGVLRELDPYGRSGDELLSATNLLLGMLNGIAKAVTGPGKAQIWAVAGPASIQGVPPASYTRISAPVDTVWVRDYGPGIQTGAQETLTVPGKNLTLDVVEITGLVTGMDDKIHGMASLTERADEISAAVRTNSEITARAVKDALQAKLAALKEQRFAPDTEPVRLKGYRVTRKIGAGGMTEVYLAEREADGLPIVLKVLDSRGKEASEHLVRFIQEYALLSQIKHPNVIRIHDQGFSDEHAYIAMEYFERGDLRGLFGPGMTREQALAVVQQLALALAAIHSHGIVHRDIKPENVMLRNDGSVALADFGIAKSTLQAESLGLTQTRHGDVVGTPYYMSPEQVSGKAVTARSDLYSLGVMLFEMLAGRRPFIAESLELLLARHLHADTPVLPAAHAALQPIVNRLMAKNPDNRYASADALLADLARVS